MCDTRFPEDGMCAARCNARIHEGRNLSPSRWRSHCVHPCGGLRGVWSTTTMRKEKCAQHLLGVEVRHGGLKRVLKQCFIETNPEEWTCGWECGEDPGYGGLAVLLDKFAVPC